MDGEGAVDFIIKLGGGAVTHKYDFETAKLDEIKEASHLLKECYKSGLKFVVSHGAGSYGHFQAKQYAVDKGFLDKTESDSQMVKDGFCKTRISVMKLNNMIVNSLEEEGLPAVALSACGTWTTQDGSVVKDGADAILQILNGGFIPVIHGDCVMDTKLGCAILSSDTIAEVLSTRLHPKRVIFLSDVEGIHDRPPEEDGAQLLREITVSSDGSVNVPVQTNMAGHDVSGGIQKKIMSAARIVHQSQGAIPVFICDIDSDAAKQAALHGDLNGLPGTKITYQ